MSSEHARRGVLLALVTAYLAYVFRLTSGQWLRMGLGDWIDPYFINSLLEDWRYSLTNLASPASPPVFFPVRGTLGYSHSLMLYAPVYLVARLWLDPLMAYTATLFTIVEIGTLSLYVAFRRFVGLGFVESLLGVAVFATSGNVINGATGVWSQRASIFLLPPILLLALRARTARGWRRTMGLGCSALLAVSLFTQDIYTGLLTAIIVGLLGAGARRILGWPRAGIRITLWRREPAPIDARRRAAAIAAAVVVALSLAVALQHTFGDLRHRHPGRALAVAAIAAVACELLRGGTRDRVRVTDPAAVSDLAAVSAGALGGVVIFVSMYAGAFVQHPRFPAEELLEHLTPLTQIPFDSGRTVVMIGVLAAAAWLPWLRLSRQVRLCSLWFVLATVVVLAIPVRSGDIGLWKYLSEAVPGFAAIRDPRRIQYPFELAAALGIGLFIAQLPRGSWPRRAVFAFVLIVIVVKWNRERFDYERPREMFERFVEAPIAIDPSCRSFFVTHARSAAYTSRSTNKWALYANDASFIATAYRLPTLNGYSAWTPPDWHLFNPEDSDYPSGVARWIALNRLEHVCELDIERRTMTPYTAGSPGVPR